MTATFTRRVSVAPKTGVDPRYSGSKGVFWSVTYIDAAGELQSFNHFGPESVKERLEGMGVPYDFGVKVDFHAR